MEHEPTHASDETCERCGRHAATRQASFHQHVGLVVLGHHEVVRGRLCRICIGEVFRRTTWVSALFGWWGLFSAFVTLAILPLNVLRFRALRRLDPPPPGALPSASARARWHRQLRFGYAPFVLGAWVLFGQWLATLMGLGTIALVGLTSLGESSAYWMAPLVVLAPQAALTLLYGVLSLRATTRVASGTRGRGRLLVLSWSALAHVIASAVVTACLSVAMTDTVGITFGLGASEPLPLGAQGLVDSIQMVTQGQGTFFVLVGALAVQLVAGNVAFWSAIASWFLIPLGLRKAFWAITDLTLLFAFLTVTFLLPLPIQPPADAPDAWLLPSIRLAITTLAAARLLFRGIPIVLDLLEGRLLLTFLRRNLLPFLGGFRLRVASRMLRSNKSGFLTAIGALSILAVAFSSCTLTTTLSVMGGFRNDLKRKILGNNAHVVIDRERGTFEGWEPTLETIRESPHVIGASPYVEGEVMITSATNLAGAILRGIDPDSIGGVTELPRNIRAGRLQYLSHPEELTHLSADEYDRDLLAPPIQIRSDGADDGTPPPPIPEPSEHHGFLDDAEDVLGHAAPDPDEDPDTARIRQDLDEFLLDTPPSAEPSEPEVLPGLIVGQELARTLRLHVGDRVDVVSPNGELGPSGPMPKSRPFRVAGIFYSGMYEFDMKMAYTTLGAAQEYLNIGSGVHGIEVKVDDAERAISVASAIASAIHRPELRVRPWQEVNRSLFGALQLEKLAMFITLGIAILVASFCIVGALTLMVQEKRKEVGILKAMGATGEQIVAVFMAQGLMIGVLGALMGLGLGYLTCFAAEHFRIIPLNPEVYYIDRLPVHVDPVEFALTAVAAVVVCLLATIYPALLGSRLRPVDALRYT